MDEWDLHTFDNDFYLYCVTNFPTLSTVATKIIDGEKKVIGSLLATKSDCKKGIVVMFAILPEHRGKGIGKKMLKQSLKDMKLLDCTECQLQT